jgi:signal-transduction protein with cAMP-binding, CBS, and nucleotidyltransferase domain
MRTCREIMIENPACCLPTDKIYVAAQRMQTEDTDALIVVKNYEQKTLVGILTDRDIALRVIAKGRNVANTHVSDIMTLNPMTCSVSDDLDTTLNNMLSRNIRRIPVVDKERLVIGMIAQAYTIQVRIAVRVNSENRVTAITVKDSFEGWADFTTTLPIVLKQLSSLNKLTQALNDPDNDLRFIAAATS